MIDARMVLDLLAAGDYWPALSVALLLTTKLVRRGLFDPWIERLRRRYTGHVHRDNLQHAAGMAVVTWGLGHLRALLPLVLAGAAWAICVALPWDVSATEAAYTALLSALGAMGIYDAGKAGGTALRALAARPQLRAADRAVEERDG
jgi:hypothetical protein